MSIWTEVELLIRILIAGLSGALIGNERKNRKKEAGVRTHIIVALASALMMIVSKYAFFDMITGNLFPGAEVRLDPSRIASCIVSGIGFLGAGMIFTHKTTVTGLTTAAGIWATAGVGMAIGAGLYIIGIFGAVLIVVVQILLHKNIFIKTVNHENIIYVVNNYDIVMEYIENGMKKAGVTIDGFEMKKLEDKRAEIDFDVSFTKLEWGDIMKIAHKCENIESVRLG